MNKEVVLSHRLQGAAAMVTSGHRVVDVGCDHGFVSIYLVQRGISPRCLAMDVRTGPLSRAREHVAVHQLEQYIETRLSDGLRAYEIGEADAMLCCGMGGPLMTKILEESREKAQSLKELILQPQSEIPEFRRYLRKNGYLITAEDMVLEEGKYYFIIHAVPLRTETGHLPEHADEEGFPPSMQLLWDAFGQQNLEKGHPVLYSYLEYRLRGLGEIAQQLSGQKKERTMERMAQLEQEKALISQALKIYFKR